jgi:hypothetical protein
MGTIFYGIPAVAPALAKSVFGLIGAITSLIILFVLAFPKRLRKSV